MCVYATSADLVKREGEGGRGVEEEREGEKVEGREVGREEEREGEDAAVARERADCQSLERRESV